MKEKEKKQNKDKDQNPKDSIQDTSISDHENNGSTKKSHKVMNENSRKDIIDKNTNQSPRDSV